mmetsp:Transcript_3706/g.6111  ORF Transcript_3706/g.6111 Transcript_3706/m.6111 type:complete len:272 (+) Transcript_3706:666-1481(+)
MLEALEKPSERPALQAVPHFPDIAEVSIPRLFPLLILRSEAIEIVIHELPAKIAVPRITGTGSILLTIAYSHVFRCCAPIACLAPHVRNLRFIRSHNFASAQPNAQALVQIFATPTEHVPIIATCFVPPSIREAQKASRDYRHVWIVGVEPLEIHVPSEVAFGSTHSACLRPCVNVEYSNLRHYHPSPILTDELQEVLVPPCLRSNVTVEENQDVAGGSIAAVLLSSDQAFSLLVTHDLHLVPLLYIFYEVCLRQGRVTAVVNHHDFMEHV